MKCPCCGGVLPKGRVFADANTKTVVIDGARLYFRSLKQFQFMESLIKVWPATARYAQIVENLWPDPHYQPDDAMNTAKTYATHARNALSDFKGAEIKCEPQVGYRLVIKKAA